MYQKLVIREADCTCCVQNKGQPREKPLTLAGRPDPDGMIIYSDWPTTLRCSTAFGYKKDDGRGCETDVRECARVMRCSYAVELRSCRVS